MAILDFMQTRSTDKAKKETFWTVPFVVLMVMNLFQSMAMYMSNTVLPLYVDYLGAAASIIGLIVGVGALVALATRPFAGPAFDSFPRKGLLAISQACCGIAVLLYGFSTDTTQMMLIRIIHGLGMGGAGPLAMSLVTEQIPFSRLASGMGIYSIAQSLAQVIGPALGLWLSALIGYSNVFIVSGAVVLISLTGLLFVPEKDRVRPPYQLKLNRIFAKEAVDKGFVLMMLLASFSCVGSYLVLYSKQLGIEDVSLYFIVYALCLIVTRPVFGNIADRVGVPRVLVFCLLCFVVSFVMLSQVKDFTGFMVIAVISSLGYGVSMPLVQTLVMSSVPNERRGAASNTSFFGLDAGNLIGPVMAGLIIDHIYEATGSQLVAYSNVWLIMLIPIAIAFVIVIKWNIDRSRNR